MKPVINSAIEEIRSSIEIKNNILMYRDVPVLKAPWDLEIILLLIEEIRPTLIIETGTAYGGSAFLYADFMRLIGTTIKMPSVITVEDRSHYKGDGTHLDPVSMTGYIPDNFKVVRHPDVLYIERNSLDEKTLNEISKYLPGRKVLVNLDSDHHWNHVTKELQSYSKFVSVNSYLIVEDMKINLVHLQHGTGPDEAVYEFLKGNNSFEIDKSQNNPKSLNIDGYLRRVK